MSAPKPLGLPVWLLLHPLRPLPVNEWHLLEPLDVTYPSTPGDLLSCPIPNPRALASYVRISTNGPVKKAHLRRREGLRRAERWANLPTLKGDQTYAGRLEPRALPPRHIRRLTMANDPRRLATPLRRLVLEAEVARMQGIDPATNSLSRAQRPVDYVKHGLPPPPNTPTVPWLTEVFPLDPGLWIVHYGPPASPNKQAPAPPMAHLFPWERESQGISVSTASDPTTADA